MVLEELEHFLLFVGKIKLITTYMSKSEELSRKNLQQKFIFQLGSLNSHRINERFSFV